MIPLLNGIIDRYKDEMVSNLQKLLQIQSIAGEPEGDDPFGKSVQEAFSYMMELGEAKGFACRNFDNYAGDLSFGETDCVGVVSHLDVVPEGDGWKVPAFSGQIIDGKIFGRGAVDDKGCAIAAFYACLAIKESGLPLSKGLRQILGTCEEGGVFPCMKHYMEKTTLPGCGIVPDAWFPAVYAEKSFCTYAFQKKFDDQESADHPLTLVNAEGGSAVNVVPSSAAAEFIMKDCDQKADELKKLAEREGCAVEIDGRRIKVLFHGKSAHASKPELGINAINKMLGFLSQLTYAPATVCNTIRELSPMVAQDVDGTAMGINYSDQSGALTNNVGLLSYSNEELNVKLNLRSPVTVPQQQMEADLKRVADALNMDYCLLNYNPHFYIEKDDWLVRKLVEVYRDVTGDKASQPVAHGAGSYARVMKNFVPFGPLVMGESLSFHQPDEHISIEKLVSITKIYAQALYALAR